MQQVDARLNEWQGALDAINGITLTDARTNVNTLNSLNASVSLDIVGKATLMVHLNVTSQFNGSTTLIVEGTSDGTNFFQVPFFIASAPAGGPAAESLETTIRGGTIVGQYLLCTSATGFKSMRVRMNAFLTTGTAIVAMRATQADFRIYTQALPATLTANLLMSATGPTAFIAAPSSGLFVYLTSLCVTMQCTTATVTAVTPPTLTLSNFAGLVMNVHAIGAIGECRICYSEAFAAPVKSTAAATVINATLSALPVNATYRILASYYLGA